MSESEMHHHNLVCPERWLFTRVIIQTSNPNKQATNNPLTLSIGDPTDLASHCPLAAANVENQKQSVSFAISLTTGTEVTGMVCLRLQLKIIFVSLMRNRTAPILCIIRDRQQHASESSSNTHRTLTG